jgi:hypothetical protein
MEGLILQDLEKGGDLMPARKSKFDESKLTPRQRKGYDIAKAQGARTIASIEELRLDIDAEELEEFIQEIGAERQRARQQTPKNYF